MYPSLVSWFLHFIYPTPLFLLRSMSKGPSHTLRHRGMKDLCLPDYVCLPLFKQGALYLHLIKKYFSYLGEKTILHIISKSLFSSFLYHLIYSLILILAFGVYIEELKRTKQNIQNSQINRATMDSSQDWPWGAWGLLWSWLGSTSGISQDLWKTDTW